MFRFESLYIWNDAVLFVSNIYRITSSFPADEKYGLTSQLRRASVSVSANIAEGSAAQSKKEFRVFLGYSIRF